MVAPIASAMKDRCRPTTTRLSAAPATSEPRLSRLEVSSSGVPAPPAVPVPVVNAAAPGRRTGAQAGQASH